MNEFSVFIVIIILIVSILQIALFIKIWQMTKDAAEIKEVFDIFLYKNYPHEKRIKKAVSKVYTMFYNKGVVLDKDFPISKLEQKAYIEKKVFEIIDKNRERMEKILGEKYLDDVYSIDELKRDVVNRFLEKLSKQ